MSDLASWLEPRLANAPASLRERILGVLEAGNLRPGPPGPAPRSPLPNQLHQLAEGLLESVKNAGDGAVALDLLAADALITYACEALSERDPDGLADIA